MNNMQRATTSGGLVKTSVQLAPDQLEAIDQLAARKRLSRPAMVRQLIDLGLRQQSQMDRIADAVA